jgi:hypothetical protein
VHVTHDEVGTDEAEDRDDEAPLYFAHLRLVARRWVLFLGRQRRLFVEAFDMTAPFA